MALNDNNKLKRPGLDPQVKEDFAATFNPRSPSFANAAGGGTTTAPAPTIATATPPASPTPQLRRDFGEFFGGAAAPSNRIASAPVGGANAPTRPLGGAPLRLGGLAGAAQALAGMTPMATAPAESTIHSLVPANGGRAPGGPFDLNSFAKPPAAVKPPAAAVTVTPPDVALKSANLQPPPGFGAGKAAMAALPRATSAFNSGLATIADSAVGAYGAADNFVRGAFGTSPVRYPEHPVLRVMANNGMVMVGEPSSAAPAARPPAPSAPPAAPTATPLGRAAAPVAQPLATATPATAANAAELTHSGTAPGAGATSVGGRQLGYGAMVNGVRVFSDGSGGANAPARTMTDEQIAGLATGARLSRADPGVGGGIGTAAAGGTPELGAFTGRVGEVTRPATGVNYAAARADNIEAQRMAASDAASIASGDTRSVLGRAARNAQIDANSSFGSPKLRRERLAATMDALNKAALGGIPAQDALGRSAIEDAGQTTRAGITADASIAGDMLRRPGASQVNLADGTLGLVGADGIVRPALTPSGTPARTLQTKDDSATKRAAEVEDAFSKTATTLLSNSTLGQAATPEQIVAAKVQAAQLHNLRTATGPNGQKLVEIGGEWKPL